MTTSTHIQIYLHDFYLESARQWWNFTLHIEIPDWLEKRLNKGLFLNIQHIQFSLLRSSSLMLCYAKSLQSCPTLCDPRDGSPPGSPIPWILQARTLGWVAIYFSNAWKWKVKGKSLSHVRLLATPWIAA